MAGIIKTDAGGSIQADIIESTSSGAPSFPNGLSGDVTGNVTGNITGNVTGEILGVTDGSSAGAGEVGEFLSSTVAAVPAAGSNVQKSITSLVLTPGVWLCSAGVASNHTSGGTTVTTLLFAGIADTPNVGPNGWLGGGEFRGRNSFAIGGDSAQLNNIDNFAFSFPNEVISVSANHTVYLNCRLAFSGGTPTWDGYLSAVRIR